MKIGRFSQRIGFVLSLLGMAVSMGCSGDKTTTEPSQANERTARVAEEELDSVLYVVHCGEHDYVLQGGGLSIIYVIDNIGGGSDPAFIKINEYCAIGLEEGRAPEGNLPQNIGHGDTCDPTGSQDYSESTPVIVAAAHWCDHLYVVDNCLHIPTPDGEVGINLVSCSAKLTFIGDSIAIRTGCGGNTANSTCE